MGVTGPGKSVDSILRRRPDEHPFAIPVAPGAQGLWPIRVTPTPIGYVLKRSEGGGFVYDVYAHCRDDKGGRPWLKTFRTFNSAVAWAVQHERDIFELIAKNSPEPELWPPQQ